MTKPLLLLPLLLLTATARAAVTLDQTFDGGITYTATVTITNDTADSNLWAVDIASPGMVPGIAPENWYTAQFDADAFAWVSGLVGAVPVGSDVPPGGTVAIVFQRFGAPVEHVDYTLQFTNAAGDTERSGTIPEPGTLAMLGAGLVGLLGRRHRKGSI